MAETQTDVTTTKTFFRLPPESRRDAVPLSPDEFERSGEGQAVLRRVADEPQLLRQDVSQLPHEHCGQVSLPGRAARDPARLLGRGGERPGRRRHVPYGEGVSQWRASAGQPDVPTRSAARPRQEKARRYFGVWQMNHSFFGGGVLDILKKYATTREIQEETFWAIRTARSFRVITTREDVSQLPHEHCGQVSLPGRAARAAGNPARLLGRGGQRPGRRRHVPLALIIAWWVMSLYYANRGALLRLPAARHHTGRPCRAEAFEPTPVFMACMHALDNLSRTLSYGLGLAGRLRCGGRPGEHPGGGEARLPRQSIGEFEGPWAASANTVEKLCGIPHGSLLKNAGLHQAKDQLHGGGVLDILKKYATTREIQEETFWAIENPLRSSDGPVLPGDHEGASPSQGADPAGAGGHRAPGRRALCRQAALGRRGQRRT